MFMLIVSWQPVKAADAITVYAAASLSNVIDVLSKQYQQTHPLTIKTSYAASGTLAKQIAAGAMADIFISADVQWMDYLNKSALLQASSRINLLGNRLVFITPQDSLRTSIDFKSVTAPVFQGKVCTGDPMSVPVGKYAKQSLQALGWWSTVEPRIVATDDVRSALNFVDQGACALGIVYATDALLASHSKVVGTFPESTHLPIVYPIALTQHASPLAKDFYQFLQSNTAKKVYAQYGFKVLF